MGAYQYLSGFSSREGGGGLRAAVRRVRGAYQYLSGLRRDGVCGGMHAQLALGLPSTVDEGVVVVNGRCQVRQVGDHRVVVVAGLPIHRFQTS